jgi:hypothetical protein
MDDKKEAVQSRKWAIITLHRWLPSQSEQVARARAWGLQESRLGVNDVSGVILDDVRKVGRTTNWAPKLVNRAAFLQQIAALKADGDMVFFVEPLAVGFSEREAHATMDALLSIGALVYVHSTGSLYRSGDDLSDFLEQVRLAANAAHQRDHRRRQV